MKKLLKKMLKAKCKFCENAIPIMSFLIVVLALRPYCYGIRGYHAIGGEYILAGLVAFGTSRLIHKEEGEKE